MPVALGGVLYPPAKKTVNRRNDPVRTKCPGGVDFSRENPLLKAEKNGIIYCKNESGEG